MRTRKKIPFSDARVNSKFKITNWPEYNNILRNRGRIDFMIAENLSLGWYEDHSGQRKRGGQRRYSDKAILMCLQIRCLLRLPLRQTQGFINWLFMMSGMDLTCPDYTTLSIRGKKLCVESLLDTSDEEFDCVCIDSSGIQTFTGNEWLENKHGKQYKRRIWKKLHIVTTIDGHIIANSMTEHTKDDRSQVQPLLDGIRAKELLGDSGYDGENIYQVLRKKGMKPTIRPPNRSLTKKGPAKALKTERQKEATYLQERGYNPWRVKNNYGRRERVENTFYRFKTSFGSQFLSRDEDNMKNELTIKCHLLNKMFEIGRPISMRVS
jgi:transposase